MTLRTACLLVIAAVFLGCATQGNPNLANPSLTSRIQPYKTMKPELQSLFGEPDYISRESGAEYWVYSYFRSRTRPATFVPFANIFAGGSDAVGYTMTIYFNPDGTVKYIDSGKFETHGGSILD